jgi:hypothetical protein
VHPSLLVSAAPFADISQYRKPLPSVPRIPLANMGKPRVRGPLPQSPARAADPGTDDYPGAPCTVGRKQEPRHPPVHPRPPRQAHPAGLEPGMPRTPTPALRRLLPGSLSLTTRAHTGRGSGPPASFSPQTRRHDPVLHVSLSTHARDHRRHPAHPHLGRARAFALSAQQDHRL